VQHGRIELCEKLMGENDADFLLARFGQNDLDLGIVADVVVALVDIDEAGESLPLGQARSLRRRLIDEREEEAAEELSAFLLQQALFRIDQNDLARRVDLLKEIDL